MPAPNELQSKIVNLLKALAPEEGYNLTRFSHIRFLRSNRPLTRTPVLYDPGIVIVCQGRKRGYLGDQVYRYDARHYLVVSVPLPFSMETEASAEEPMLAMYLRLDFNIVADLMLQFEARESVVEAEPKGMVSTPMDDRLAVSVFRFLEAMSNPLEADILGPALIREIYFRIFVGEQGGSMRAALANQGHFGKIAKALRLIHTRYAQALSVEDLASEASMSVSTFHAHFRQVTETSPMQYLKSTRLHQGRLLMAREEMTAAAACARVGYESASQFSREFKRLFGRSPTEEIARMKSTFGAPHPSPNAVFISSH